MKILKKLLAKHFFIPLLYLLLGLMWIHLSDSVLFDLLEKKLLNRQSLMQVGKFKGFFYVSATALLLYFLIRIRSQLLMSSRQDFKRLFEDNPNPMWIYDRHTLRILLVNKAACHQYGYGQEEFLRISLYDLRPQAYHKILENSVESAQEGYSDSGQWLHQNKAGIQFYVHIFSHSILYQHKSCRLVIAINVHEKVLLEQQLKLRNQRLSEIAWQQSHEVRRPVANILGIIELIKLQKNTVSQEENYIPQLEQSATELDRIIRTIVAKTNNLDEA